MERVGIYNRCSTEEESQRNALASQALESREIAEKKGWSITEQYIESQTGTVAYKRSEYQRLLADMEKDRFDIVMIKSIDRLMRSARDWYFFLSRLTENSLKLYIYIEGKFYTPEDNLISGIKAILAEDFSRELSKKIRNAHRRRQEKKSGCNITCEMFGWNKVAKDTYEVNIKEAEYYRTAFSLAKEGKGFYTISNMLYELGARGRNGQRISEAQWRKMLYTPRAHGTMILNTRIYNFDTKRYEKVPENDWIIMEHALPPIVSKEYQEEVVEIMKKKAKGARERKEQGKKYDFTRKLICAECGRTYYRTCYHTKAGKKVVWKCAAFLEGGRKKEDEHLGGCDNRHLPEEEIYQYMAGVLSDHKEMFDKKEQLSEMCRTKECLQKEHLQKRLMHAISKSLKEGEESGELSKLEKEHKKLMGKKDVLMEKLLRGVIEDEDYEKYSKNLTERIYCLAEQIAVIKQEKEPYNNYEMRLKKIEEAVKEENLIEKALLKETLKKIDLIKVHKDGRFEIYAAMKTS
ncbi:recombinase family protein [Parablautia muri]|uniref:Recombinase family protein n=1 Tax=Parablautia muri TaxID=2320879 RepID=A0A9X5BGS3_9FIRM|nr:recombinase family protein [Parablautia muri]